MSKILISGSSGFIGQKLTSYLRGQGHTVVKLVRTPYPLEPESLYWNPETADLTLSDLEGFDEVIHLAGSPIFQKRWTERRKREIFLSRCRDTWVLSHALSSLKKPPSYFFSASAIGYYGDRGSEIVSERASPGAGFLSDVCVKWEKASDNLREKGIRVVHGRFGVVIDPSGGLFKKLVPIFRLGLGGKLGTGHQWMSWISLEDLIRALDFTRHHSHLSGAFNFTSPHPVTNQEFTQILAQAMHKKAFCHVPAFLLKLFLGEVAKEAILASTRAAPCRLLENGFIFNDPYLVKALSKMIQARS